MTTIQLNDFFASIKTKLDQIKSDLSAIGVGDYAGPGTDLDGDAGAPKDDATIEIQAGTLVSGDGNANTLVGTAYFNVIDAKGGNDTVVGSAGYDLLFGGSGIDAADYSYLNTGTNGVWADLSQGFAVGGENDVDNLHSIENLIGTKNDDVLIGNSANNLFRGTGGNDIVDGRGGIDVVQLEGLPEDYTVTALPGDVGFAFTRTVGLTTETVKVIGIEFAQFASAHSLLFSIQNEDGSPAGSVIAKNDSVEIDEDAGHNGPAVTLEPLSNDEVLGVVLQKLISFTGPGGVEQTVTFGSNYASLIVNGDFGSLTLNSDGTVTYAADARADALSADEHESDVFTYKVAGGDNATITINITGTNDAPVLSVPPSTTAQVVETADNHPHEGSAILTTGGLFSVHDVDSNFSGNSVSVVGSPTAVYDPVNPGQALPPQALLAFQFNVTPDGIGPGATSNVSYTFSAFDAAIEFLGEGDKLTLTYTVRVTDGDGAHIDVSVPITVIGKNDAVNVTSAVNPLPTDEAADASSQDISVTGSINVTDVDDNDVLTTTFSGGTATLNGIPVDNSHPNWAGINALLSTANLSAGLATSNGGAVAIPFSFDGPNAALDFLASGDTLVLNFVATVSDGLSSDPNPIEITITGTNDAPVITGDVAGSVAEDGTLVASGSLSDGDVDLADVVAWSGNASSSYGAFVVDPSTGAWTYTLDNGAAQSLAEGQVVTETYTVTADDGEGGTDTIDIEITITGTNDAPVITGDVAGSVAEDGTLVASGSLSDGDVDLADVVAWSGNASSSYGAFVVDPSTGAWTYTLDNGAAQSLAEGQVVTETYTVTADDGEGGTDTIDIEITITGTNDAPVITGDVAGSVAEDGTLVASGSLSDGDVDLADVVAWSGNASSSYGAFVVDPSTGAWTYTLDNGAAQSLAEGQVVTETYTVTADDGEGGTDTIDIEITITGTNDAPVITGDVAGSVAEDGTLVASGSLSDGDVDLADVVAWSGNASSSYGAFVVDPSTGAWTYTLDNGAAQSLAEGQVVTETYTVTADDGEGGTDTIDIEITITGTNDAPVITGDVAGSVAEDGTLVASGSLSDGDVDLADVVAWSGNASSSYGAFVVDPSTGAWTYTLDNGAAQSLAEGQVVTETYTVTADDGEGGTDTIDIEITITGTNDAPVITGDVAGSVAEDGTLVASGSLSDGDVDLADVVAWSGNASSSYGAFVVDPSTGAWTYTLDNGAAQSLAEGQVVTETYTVTADDGEGGTDTIDIEITITGTNDAPVITGDVAGSVAEDGTLVASGSLSDGDVDLADVVAWSGNASSSYGAFVVDPSTGAWTYTLDNGAAQSLAEGQVVTETYTVTADDGEGGTDTIDIEITITGTNDAPVITGDVAGSVAEDGTLVASGSLSDGDVDLADVVAWSGNASSSYGAFVVDPSTGAWTYTLDNGAAQSLAEGQVVTETYTVTADDGEGGTDTIDIEITITGTNDAPSLGFAQRFSVDDAGLFDGDSGWSGNVTRVADGTNGINTLDGGHFALIEQDEPGTGPFTRLDGYRNDFVDGLTTGVKVYLDTDWATGKGFDYSVAANGSDGVHQRDFVFHVAKDASGQLLVNGSTGSNHSPSNAAPRTDLDTLSDSFEVDASGWYTLQHVFNDVAGVLSVDLQLVDGSGTVIWTKTISVPEDTLDQVGGNRYGWFTLIDVDGGLAIDDVTLGNLSGTLIEVADGGLGEGTATLTAEGKIPFKEVDLSDSHVVNSAPVGTGYVGTFVASLGDSATGDGEGTVAWTFAVNDGAIEHLGVGETLTQQYTVTLDDGHGPVTQIVTITIAGSNDGPVIDQISSDLAGSITENSAASPSSQGTISGQIEFEDIDETDTPTASLTGSTITYTPMNGAPTNIIPASLNAGLIAGAFSWVNQSTGTWAFNSAGVDLEGLAEGDTLVIDYAVQVDDGNGGTDTTTVSITIVGTNDAPTINAISGNYDEDDLDDLAAGINLLVEGGASDVDEGDEISIDVGEGMQGTVTLHLNDEFGGHDLEFSLSFQALMDAGLVNLASDGTFQIDTGFANLLKAVMDDNDTLSVDANFTITDGTVDTLAEISSLVLAGDGATGDDPMPTYGNGLGEVIPDLLVPTFDQNGE